MLDNSRSQRYLACVLLFVLIAAALTGAGWHMIHAAGYESGDFAANSLLVQDAKHLRLIYGNYSRIGFNHPGPAILYVLAFGELLFHDWLHIVPSPFAGQIVAGLLYNAAWMVLVFAIVRRIAGALQALLFLAVFVLVTLCVDSAFVDGLWFPHLYFFPYAAMLVSIAPLAYGRADTLKALAVSSGFLINGHASFIPMLGVMLVLMLAANWVVTRKEPSRRILSRGWMNAHGRSLLAAVGILILFLVPLMIATVEDYPGPLYDYLHYGRLNKGNSWPAALQFVLVFWGTGRMRAAGLALALVLAVLLLTARSGARTGAGQAQSGFVDGARGLGIALAAASLALLYYAKAGVDDLGQMYVAFFYYSVPAMSAALVALFVCRSLPAGARDPVAGVLALGVLAVSWPWLRQEPPYIYDYNQPATVEMYERLRALPGNGRIVLDLKQDPDNWGKVAGSALGLQAYARRQHVDLVCIGEHWNISNTRPARCRPEELASNRRYEVVMADTLDPARGAPDIEVHRVALYRFGAPPRPLAYVTVKEQPDYFHHILGRGWSTLEGDYVWTDGPVAQIDLPADPARGRRLMLDLGSFTPGFELRQHAQAYVDGRPAGQLEWGFDEPRRRFSIDLGSDPGAAKHIELRIAGPVTPKQFGLGEDTRQLGLSLYGIDRESK
jgi:hypothetical protein